MRTLLIVDDEFIIRKGLSEGVDWAALDIALLPAAESAEQALATAQQTMPDILITDISMPGKNGIALIDELEAQNPQLKSIILTGYDEFDYAKRAVDLKVYKYLLKPVAPDVLLETVRALLDEMTETAQQQRELSLLRQKFADNIDTLREYFLNSVLLRRYSQSAKILDEQTLFQIGLDKTRFGVLVVQTEETKDAGEQPYLGFLQLEELAKQLTDSRTELYPVYLSAAQIAVVVCGSDDEIVKTMGERLLPLLQNALHQTCAIGVSNPQTAFTQLALAYEEAQEAASYQRMTGGNALICIEDILPESDCLILFPQQELSQLIAALKNRAAAEFSQLIQSLFLPLRRCKKLSLAYAQQLTVEFLSASLRAAEQYGIPLGVPNIHDVWRRVFAAETLDQMEMVLQTVYDSIAQQNKQQNSAAQIAQIKAYLEQNYTRKLNLTEVSQRFYLSYSYLSLLFKRETGYNISDYLNQLRIAHAKQLLTDESIKVHEVGALVGIEDSHYFTRIFKKQTGLTPSQYREQH